MSRARVVALRPARPGDAPLLATWRREPSVRRFQPLPLLSATDLGREIAGRGDADLAAGRGERFDWIVLADDRPAGWITLAVHSWRHGLAECGYALSTPFQGRGIMPRALELLLDEVFDLSTLVRIEARCAVENRSSQRVLERLGFTREGRLRSYFDLDGERVDNYLYAVLATDWTEADRPEPVVDPEGP